MIQTASPRPSRSSTPLFVPPPPTPDVAVAALSLFARLRDGLRAFAPPPGPARRWGVPPLFFFDPELQAEWTAARGEYKAAARPLPAGLLDFADDAVTVLTASADARRAGRAVPGLTAAVAAAATTHPRLREVADLLAVADDEVMRVIHPGARAGFRVRVRGVADLYQFHVLLTDAVTGGPARGRLPGPRPDPRVVAAYRDGPVDPGAAVGVARFQLFRPAALRPDGTVPAGFGGSGDWLWGPEPVAAVPRVGGERVVLLGDPAYRATWDVARKLPRLDADLDVIEVMTPAAVADWIETQTGRPLAWAGDGAVRRRAG